MDQVAKDGQGFGPRVLVRQGNGIANAETHSEMLRADDADRTDGVTISDRQRVTLHYKVIIDDESKLVKQGRAEHAVRCAALLKTARTPERARVTPHSHLRVTVVRQDSSQGEPTMA